MLKMFLSAVATGNDTSSADPGGGMGGSNPSPFNFQNRKKYKTKTGYVLL